MTKIREGRPLLEFFEASLLDPFSETTRRARNLLLLTSLIGLAISWAGFVPSEISALGIKLEGKDERRLFILLVAVVSYALARFVCHSISDLLAWQANRNRTVHDELDRQEQHCLSPDNKQEELPEIDGLLTPEQQAQILDGSLSFEAVIRSIRFDSISNTRRLLKESFRSKIVHSATEPVAITRTIIETIVPIAVGLATVSILVAKIFRFASPT